MDSEKVERLIKLIQQIEVTEENEKEIEQMKQLIKQEHYNEMLQILQKLNKEGKITIKKEEDRSNIYDDENEENGEEEEEDLFSDAILFKEDEEEKEEDTIYPEKLQNTEIEEKYISMLLANPKALSMYYVTYDDCYFQSWEMQNLYKSILFTDGESYAPQIAKDNFNYARENARTYERKIILKEEGQKLTDDFENVYTELIKLFIIRKNYLKHPIKETQQRIMEILDYKMYDQMTIQEVKDAIEQITATEKFKRAVLSQNITDFLITGENTLTSGLRLPFPILNSVFKGIRKGETMSYAMPSNSGKSRFAICIAAYIAFVHKKKVLIISNEMSEEKMKLCLITTILNNPEIQKLHKQKLSKTEGELLEFKFRPDKGVDAELDENGFIARKDGEKQKDFAKRLEKLSEEYRKTVAVTDWVETQIANSIEFVNITNHTNDELEKVILNYYYKSKIEYVFYDTLKTDIENIGNSEEIKKTATVLANLAQNLVIFICSSLQLTESRTSPLNVDINDLAVSRTVKEVLDTLCLIKQIHNEDLDKYEYSNNEVDTKFFDLEKFADPDVRYYACVVDKNRAGAKPKVLFRLNLAYNMWEELGYLRLKSDNNND